MRPSIKYIHSFALSVVLPYPHIIISISCRRFPCVVVASFDDASGIAASSSVLGPLQSSCHPPLFRLAFYFFGADGITLAPRYCYGFLCRTINMLHEVREWVGKKREGGVR
jgi:hypothetical protein